MAELAAGHAGAEAVVADAYGVVLELVGERVSTFRHRTNKHAYALLRAQVGDVVPDSDDGRVEGEGDFPAVGGQVVGDGVLDDFEEFPL